MTHDEVLRFRASATHQRCIGFDKERGIFVKCGEGTGKAVPYLKASGLPLCARSRTDWERGSDPGQKDRLYRETIAEFDPSASSICPFYRQEPERDSNPGAGSFSSKRSGAWVRGRDDFGRLSWNTALTDCRKKRSSWLIGSWFLRRCGKRDIGLEL